MDGRTLFVGYQGKGLQQVLQQTAPAANPRDVEAVAWATGGAVSLPGSISSTGGNVRGGQTGASVGAARWARSNTTTTAAAATAATAIATTAAAQLWLGSARSGYCARTTTGASDCEVGDQGSWPLSPLAVETTPASRLSPKLTQLRLRASVERCLELCAACGRCHFISVSRPAMPKGLEMV